MSDVVDTRYLSASSRTTHRCPILFGCPFDETVSFRSGARFGPQAIRQASQGLETYSPDFDIDLDDIEFQDIGNLELPSKDIDHALKIIRRQTSTILDQENIPFALGGEHTITLPIINELRSRHPSLKVIQMDAHLDLRYQYLDHTICHATVMRRISETVGIENILQLGVRSGTREEWQLAKKHNTIDIPKNGIAQWIGNSPAYLTVDLDVFDPGVMGGTGTPEPGGWNYQDFAELIKQFQDCNWVGMDVVELSPHFDPTGASSMLAARVVRDLIMILQQTS
jgi:agmatinase